MNRRYFLGSKTSRRNGSVIPLFAILVFALVPLMALIVHVGLVTLTRRQMQTAVNTAALEGLRFRDDESILEPDRELERRRNVSALVDIIFDDDLNPNNGEGAFRLGIGSDVEFDGGIPLAGTNFRALTRISSANPYTDYTLQENIANELHGDMVAGDYDPMETNHEEDDSYVRTDFTSSGDNAFLVRMRRTDGSNALDNDLGVSSFGPTIPFLFGRGPFGDAEWMNYIERGTNVRATAIAHERAVVVVGLPSDTIDTGLAHFWLALSSWAALPVDNPQTVIFNPDGTITGQAIGAFIEREVAVLGMELSPTSPPLELEINRKRWIAIYDNIEETNRIIGFGSCQLEFESGVHRVRKLNSQIAMANASAQFLVLPPADDFANVWQSFLGFVDAQPGQNGAPAPRELNQPLLAPALVRTIR